MGADIKSLRSRIKSVDSTLHLTKAMGLVASSKMRRAMDSMRRGQDYAAALTELVTLLRGSTECRKSPYMQQRETQRLRLIVIAGDRGLAGGYNANVFKLLKDYPTAEVIAIGKRACDRFGGIYHSSERFSYEDAISLSKKLCSEFVTGDYDRLGIIHTLYHSMLSQEPEVSWLLPLDSSSPGKVRSVLFEPDDVTVLEQAVPEYVAGMLIAAVRESFASEVAARRTAMDSAGKNAQQMIDNLQLEYNRARQSSITQEITEIVAGSGL